MWHKNTKLNAQMMMNVHILPWRKIKATTKSKTMISCGAILSLIYLLIPPKPFAVIPLDSSWLLYDLSLPLRSKKDICIYRTKCIVQFGGEHAKILQECPKFSCKKPANADFERKLFPEFRLIPSFETLPSCKFPQRFATKWHSSKPEYRGQKGPNSPNSPNHYMPRTSWEFHEFLPYMSC